ncbi:MAG TPA: MFS transporter [Clostridiales bacterium]|nr:MFS transporter [Clostridiales bacterium]
MEKEEKVKNPDRVPVGRLLLWRTAAFSKSASFIVIGYLALYCTDTLGLPAALVGVLMILSKISDGVTDIISGYLVDRFHFKSGKGRPWDLSLIGLWATTVLMYSVPDIGLVGKCIWIVFTFSFASDMFASMYEAAGSAYTIRAFKNMSVISKVQSYGAIIGTLLSVVVSISFPILMKHIATSGAGWTKLVLIYAVPITLIGLLRYFFVKEDYPVEVTKTTETVKIADMLKTLKVNPYILIVGGITLLANMITGMNAAQYYFKWVVGDIAKFGSLQALTLPMMFSMIFFPKLIKKFSVSFLITAGAILGAIGSAIIFLAGSNMAMLAVGFICTGLAQMPTSYMIPLMLLNCGTFNDWKGIGRMDGTCCAANNLLNKIGAGVGAGLVGVLLGAVGYDGMAASQSGAALFMIKALYSLLPLVLFALMFVLIRFYKIDKMLPQIEEDIKKRKEAAA